MQNRVASATASLPQSVQAQGVVVQQKSTSILQIITLTAPGGHYDSLFLSNYATINLVDELSRIPGVGNVNVFGVGQYSMRVWLDPETMKARGLTPSTTWCRRSATKPAGDRRTDRHAAHAGGAGVPVLVNVEGRLADPAAFGDIVVKAAGGSGGQLTQVKDVARVELGAQAYSESFRVNCQPAAGVAIFQAPDAKALAVATSVRAKMQQLARAFPQGLVWGIPFDTGFVNASIHEVYKTLIEAGVLVLIVILAFLQDWRATLVPATTVPVTIISAFTLMATI